MGPSPFHFLWSVPGSGLQQIVPATPFDCQSEAALQLFLSPLDFSASSKSATVTEIGFQAMCVEVKVSF